jgi:hypothetical protein
MAIVSVKEIHDDRGGDVSVGKKSVRKHVRRFRVITNSPYDGSYEVLSAPGLPRLGSLHPSDVRAFANHAKADNDAKSKFLWYVTVDYTTERERSENPLSDPAAIEWDSDTTQEIFTKDRQGNYILNSAGDVYADPVKGDKSNWTIVIAKNLAMVPFWIDNYRDAVNSDTVMVDGIVYAPDKLKVKKLHVSKWQMRNDIWYRELQLTLKTSDSWKKVVLDHGLHCKDPSDSSKRIRCTLDDGRTPATKSVLLDGSGNKLANPSPSTAVANTHEIYNPLPFYVLPLN